MGGVLLMNSENFRIDNKKTGTLIEAD